MKMVEFMKALGKRTKEMAKVARDTLTIRFTLANLEITNMKAMELIHTAQGRSTRENGEAG